MLYPLYVWKDDGSAYGASFPDFPGVHTAADELIDLPAMAQEAAWTMYEDGDSALPPPSTIESWLDDARFQDGFWMMVEIKTTAELTAGR
ncbi:type II toxin-antitoxin system HicB family antitoxin [Duganella sp. 1224]|uniref:type II toxin-antitoxin system HicB family antitoxin n=1 Tax=Duganella sp. 1224 TaxID=2587052 RepID=UPI0015C8EF98|nr:type II toxin-antitoxin system HicB family antitoxin [Duganella sp. 1224]